MHKKNARGAALLAMLTIAALGLSGCTPAADAAIDGHGQLSSAFDAATTEKLNAALADGIAWSASSGGIADVSAPWGGKWVVGSGTTTIGGATPMAADMHFRIGSTTRPMTCTVLLKLVDTGEVALDDKVSKYLTRMPDAEDFTLGELCQGTSGIADYTTNLATQFVRNPTRIWPPVELLSTGLAKERTETPGGGWADSNSGFVMLGLALEAATGQSWDSLYKQYIFDPVGMDDTSFPDRSDFSLPAPAPQGYSAGINADGSTVCDPMVNDTALSNSMSWVSGGVVSTVGDLSKWARTLAEGSLVSKKSATAQWTTIPKGANAASWQGYGLGVQQLGPMRGHSGSIPGFVTAAFADPDSGLTVVVMLNNSTAGVGFAEALAERFVSIAAQAPAVGGARAPGLELPWSEDQATAAMKAGAVCQPPAG
ncbi:serine hydrolase domain-containing protein [Leifsonia sp. A12D58]|uniref:serine hydrolase domain-containing protein n=1 Tax=Leifsonia sp. A12D58 TaxID=3397674 RepID=UPI0039E18AF2